MQRGSEVERVLEGVWRIESARIVGACARMLRDVGRAEELAQDAMLTALERWPGEGIPDNPAAWLMTVARNRALDALRQRALHQAREPELTYEIESQLEDAAPNIEAGLEPDLGDDVLRLMFVSCHPVLSIEAQVALTLRLLGGLSTDEIARAFLVPEPTVAQRIVRAKRSLSEAKVPFQVPQKHELQERLAAVLQVLYLIFNEGYAASSGTEWLRPQLLDEALRLGRILAALMPAEAEVHGLVALMEIQSSRNRARVGPEGQPVLLMDQDRNRWDRLLIHRGLAALGRAEALGQGLGPYGLQAAIAACHARALRPEDTDWPRIAALYEALAELNPSPVVELNRAVAVSMAYGPQAGLALVDALAAEPALARYHLLPSVRGDLLARLGRAQEARAEFERAAALTANERERGLLLARAQASR